MPPSSASGSSANDAAALVGRELADRYVLREVVASGGMAQVWRADDLVLGRTVAVKLLHPHLTSDPEFVGRFKDEAKAAARLSHPSIVAIFDTASDGDIEAIVMELIDGMTLRQFLDEHGPLSITDAIDLTRQVADALETAHAGGIVHRDIKPGNIMLCPDRRVKVTDFGIAKALAGTDRTQTGTLLGTAKYLAPEQVEGTNVDARADLYSLAIVLYESLTGQPPFVAETDAATALARLHQDPLPPRNLRPEISPAIERVIMAGLARNRDDRPPSIAAFRTALSEAELAPPEPMVLLNVAPPVDPTAVMVDPRAGALPPGPRIVGAAPPPTEVDTSDPSRRWLRPLLVLAVVLASLALAASLILTTGDPEDLGPAAPATDPAATQPDSTSSAQDNPPEVADPAEAGDAIPDAVVSTDQGIELRVSDFDPLGDNVEHPEVVANVVDGNPDTIWFTEKYDTRQLGNLKPGVGLLFQLDEQTTLNEFTVFTDVDDWAAAVYVADAASANLDGWGDPIDERSGANGNTTFDLRGVRGTAVLLWITDLGNAPPQVRMEIAEITLE